MDDNKNLESRLALVGLTVLVVVTLFAFAFLFLDAANLFSGSDSEAKPTQDASASERDEEQIAQEIRELQEQMNLYQAQLDSPYLLLVSEEAPLPAGYEVEVVPLDGDNSKYQLEAAAATALNQFAAAAEQAGFRITVDAAYRTEKQQKDAYEKARDEFVDRGYKKTVAETMAANSVGLVNCSEHQLGLAVDLKIQDPNLKGNDGKTFQEFLSENFHKYGFILSYPAGEESVTGHEADANHYRFVGVDAAVEMKEKGYVLTEYRDYISSKLNQCKEKIAAKENK